MSQAAKIHSVPKTDAQTAPKGEACFDVSIKNQIAHIVLSRPDAYNSMTPAFWRDLPRIVRDIDAHARARVILISSKGKHFTAGMDLAVFSASEKREKREISRERAAFLNTLYKIQETFSCLEEARQPVLMAIQGACIGGGMDFASAADIRYCTKDAFFSIQEINLGMTADVGTFPRLPATMPQGLVRELAYTGRRLPADEAAQCGFVNRVFDTQEDMIAHAMKIAQEIAEKSPLAVWGSKEMINHARGRTIQEGLEHIALWQAGMYHPAGDMREAFAAKQQNRAPQFPDLPSLPSENGIEGL